MVKITSAGVFLHNKNKVLLVHQTLSNMWSFPKGSKENDECNTECWKRELEEETGITYIPFHKITGSVNVSKYNITIVEMYTKNLPCPKISYPISEIDKAIWIDISKAVKMNLNNVTRTVLKDYTVEKNPYKSFESCQRVKPKNVIGEKGERRIYFTLNRQPCNLDKKLIIN